jgi:hypothetical protein
MNHPPNWAAENKPHPEQSDKMQRTEAGLTWLPETPISFYPSLACELGVEEALMVSVLNSLLPYLNNEAQFGYLWYTLNDQQLNSIAPFWQAKDIQRICTNLREAGAIVVASAPFTQSQLLKFAFKAQITKSRAPIARHAVPGPIDQPMTANLSASPNTIAPHWQPDRDTLSQLAQHNIPDTFALNHVSEFITYWRDRNEPARSWEAKFFNHIMHKWRDHQAQVKQRPQVTLMDKDWRPSDDAMEILTIHAGIKCDFIEDAVPEFVLYWREQGTSSDNWNRRFRDHVNRQWARYNLALEHDPTPSRIAEGWRPSQDVYDVLRLANIDLQFAQSLVPEFVIYWRDSNQAHSSWNTRFLQYVKRRWAQRGAEGTSPQNSSTRELSLEALVTDRSWAN